ncbi:reverse transcriptase family protein [Loigolactobacillus coryniformis]|nr:reverse transcriptase family protein [Loigolactobacillus coryniformis]MCL5458937.1 reverse transcriptase family protein [Loigolactobacillus coryniformis]
MLDTDLKTLEEIAKNPRYYSFTRPKKNSNERRIIDAPNQRLKKIQTSVYAYLRKVKRPDWVMAGEVGKNWTENAETHADDSYFVKADISKFFDNCEREYVYQFFLTKLEQSPDVADICTSLVMFEGKIVQGAPTSMVIAFYAYQKMFEELACVAKQFHCIFTIYVDDVTYSSLDPIDSAALEARISQIMAAYGHKVKRQKVRTYGSQRAKRVTGVILSTDHQMLTPNSLRQEIYADFQQYLAQKKADKDDPNLDHQRASLLGKINSARQINPGIFPEMHRILKNG